MYINNFGFPPPPAPRGGGGVERLFFLVILWGKEPAWMQAVGAYFTSPLHN